MLIKLLTKQLRQDEGTKAHVYKDSLGYWTIGVGRLVDDRKKGSGLRQVEIDFMLANDIAERIQILSVRLPWITTLGEARQGVLLNMSFQLGVEGLLGFANTLALIALKDYEGAAKGMLNSKWAQQTPGRAKRLSEQMRTDVWQITS